LKLFMHWCGHRGRLRDSGRPVELDVDLEVSGHNDALDKAHTLGLRVFHLSDRGEGERMLGTWRQDVTGKWDFIRATDELVNIPF
jgi:hypothetical protein